MHAKQIKFVASTSYIVFLAVVLLTATSYGEKSVVTDVSTLQLALCSMVGSIIAIAIFFQKNPLNFSAASVWVVLAFGCAFLAMDDAFMYHERLDKLIHSLFGWEETKLSDRIDDILVGLYGLLGMAFILLNRSCFTFSSRFINYAKSAFLLSILMVFCDSRGFGLVDGLRPLMYHLEEWTKLLGGACLFVGMLCALEDILKARKLLFY